MRKYLVTAVLLALLSFSMIAADKYDSELVVGTDQNPTTMDPAMYQDLASSQVMRNIFETLVAYTSDVQEIKPLVAESWTVSDDLKVWTFKLRENVFFQKGKFQDGRNVTAEDVKYSFDREMEISPMVRIYMIDTIEVVDTYTVKITLQYPYAPFLTVLTDIGAAIVPKEEVEGWGEDFVLHPIGSGPYVMKEWVKDDHMSFERYEDYWGEKPYVKKLTYKFIPDKAVLTLALLSGQVDITSDVLDQDIPKVSADPNVEAVMVGGNNIYAAYMNATKGPTTDQKVREAIFKAVDVTQIAKVVFPNESGVPAYGPIPPGSWAYNPDVKDFYTPYDPEGAKQILKDAGYSDGLKLKMYTSDDPNRRKMAIVMQSMLKQVGIDLEVISLEWGSFVEVSGNGEADIYAIGWTWYPDPEFFMYYMFHSSTAGTYGNGGRYNNPEVDKYIELGESSADQDERITYYRKAEELVMKDRIYFPGYHKLVVMGVSDKVKGFTVSSDMTIRVFAPGTNVYVE